MLFARRFAFGVVIDDAIEDAPVAVVAGGNFPAGQVAAVEQRYEASLASRRLRRRHQPIADGDRGRTKDRDQEYGDHRRSVSTFCVRHAR